MVTFLSLREQARTRSDMTYSNFVSEDELKLFVNGSIKELYDLLVGSYADFYTADAYQFTIEDGDQYRVPLQNIDATDAKDVGLKLRTEIAAALIQVGFDPAAVTKAVGLPDMKHTGLPSSQLQQISTIDPTDPSAAYEVK